MPDAFAALSLAASVIAFAGAFSMFYAWRMQARFAGLALFATGSFCLALAYLIFGVLRAVLPEWLVIASNNLLFLVGVTLEMAGYLAMAGRPPRWRWYGLVILTAYPAVLAGYFVWPSFAARSAIMAAALGLIEIATVISLLGRTEVVSRGSRRVLAIAVAVECAYETWRLIFHLFAIAGAPLGNPVPLIVVHTFLNLGLLLVGVVFLMDLANNRLAVALQQSERSLARAFQVASDAFMVFDRKGRLLVSNDRVAQLFPAMRDRVRKGATFTDLIAGQPEAWGITAGWTGARGPLDTEARLGDDLWVRVVGESTADGELTLCWTDITDYRRAMALLVRYLDNERELTTLQRGFMTMVSHQFRTPLSIIDLAARRLRPRARPLPAEETQNSVQRIRRAVQRMVRLIDAALNPSTARTGRIEPEFVECDLKALVEEACQRQADVTPGPAIRRDLGHLPPHLVCDPNLIDQVLSNLLSNAVKYGGAAGRITVSGVERDGHALIAVADQGIGISADDLPHVFERFFRAGAAQAFPGVGIGLAVAREIVALHGGTIDAESRVGAGSTFTISLPLRRADMPTAA